MVDHLTVLRIQDKNPGHLTMRFRLPSRGLDFVQELKVQLFWF